MNTRPFLSKVLQGKPSLSLSFSTSSTCCASSWSPKNFGECIALIQRCADRKSLAKGRQTHSHILVNGFLEDPHSVSSLINMYSKCARVSDAISVFDYLSSGDRNTFCYNAMISGLMANGRALEAFGFYKKMRELGVSPDSFTFSSVIRACCDFTEVRKIHGVLLRLGVESDVFVGSALVRAYLNFELMEHAREVFEGMPARDVVLWNSMVHGYTQIGRADEALGFFRAMNENGVVPSSFTITGVLSILATKCDLNNGKAVHGLAAKSGYDSVVEVLNALIDIYGKCRCPRDALVIFENMDKKDDFSWNSIMSVHVNCGDHEVSLRLFDRMLGLGILPDLVTIATVLPACSHAAALTRGREIHGYMIRNSLGQGDRSEDIMVNNGLMDMYTKCGHVRNALAIFEVMGDKKSVSSWNIMIMGYGTNGYTKEALGVFSRMCRENYEPDDVTFVGILSVCSHAGLVGQGRDIFSRMQTEYNIVPAIEHYACVIDMLGRVGMVKEAYEMVRTMPIEANPVVWRALLGACRLHAETDLAEIAAKRLIELEPGHCGSYVLMSNIYLEAGRFEGVSEMRDSMKEQNLKKIPGCSWIELKDGVHAFVTADRGHRDANLIYAQLISLTSRLREHGYVPLL